MPRISHRLPPTSCAWPGYVAHAKGAGIAARPEIGVTLRNQTSSTATISSVRGFTTTIWSPTRNISYPLQSG